MKSTIATLALAVGSQAFVARDQPCCFKLTAQGGPGGIVGQLGDGQNRIGDKGLPAGTYCIDNGVLTDGHGRGCILTPPTTQWQCDAGAKGTPGFSIASNGSLLFKDSTTFYVCPTEDHEGWNIYTQPLPNEHKCVQVQFAADNCFGGPTSAPPAPPPSSAPPAPSSPAQPPTSAPPAPSSPAQPPTSAPPAPSSPAQPPTSAPPAPPSPSKPPTGGPPTTSTPPAPPSYSPKPSTSAPPKTTPSGPKSYGPPKSSSASPSGPKSYNRPTPSPKSSSAPPSGPPSYSHPPSKPSSTPHSYSSASKTSSASWSSSAPAPSSTCPMDLPRHFEFPHLIVPIDATSPKLSYGNSLNGTIGAGFSTIFNFDISPSLEGKICEIHFLFPELSQLETSAYEWIQVQEQTTFAFSLLEAPATDEETWDSCPDVEQELDTLTMEPGNAYPISNRACPAGKTIGILMEADSGYFNYFQDFNPCPIGLYIIPHD